MTQQQKDMRDESTTIGSRLDSSSQSMAQRVSSPSLAAIATYIDRTREWDSSLCKQRDIEKKEDAA